MIVEAVVSLLLWESLGSGATINKPDIIDLGAPSPGVFNIFSSPFSARFKNVTDPPPSNW